MMLRTDRLALEHIRRLLRLAALAALVGISAAAAHQATYLVGSIVGSGEPSATAGIHDGRWTPLIVACFASAVLLIAVAARQIRRLAAHPQHVHVTGGTEVFMSQVLGLWVRVGASTAVIYVIQEYLEQSAIGAAPAIPELLLAHGPVPIVAVALSSLLVATVAALVRWHCRLLAARRRTEVERPSPHVTRPLCPTSDVRPVSQSGVGAQGIRAPPTPVAS